MFILSNPAYLLGFLFFTHYNIQFVIVVVNTVAWVNHLGGI